MATTVLITGANRGVGRGLAEIFLARPDHCVIGAVRDFNSASTKSLANSPAGKGSRLVLVKIESTSETDADEAAKTLVAEGIDHLDIVIANAGISLFPLPLVHEIDLAKMKLMFDVNVGGPVRLYKAVFPLLKATAETKGSGKPMFVGITSFAASSAVAEANAPYRQGPYAAGKAGLNHLVLRAQFENTWLTGFVMDPGFVDTDMGNEGARAAGLEKAWVKTSDSVAGIMKRIDGATKEATSGKFFTYDGNELAF